MSVKQQLNAGQGHSSTTKCLLCSEQLAQRSLPHLRLLRCFGDRAGGEVVRLAAFSTEPLTELIAIGRLFRWRLVSAMA